MTSMSGEEAKLLDLDMRVCGWLAVCMDVYGNSVLRVYQRG